MRAASQLTTAERLELTSLRAGRAQLQLACGTQAAELCQLQTAHDAQAAEMRQLRAAHDAQAAEMRQLQLVHNLQMAAVKQDRQALQERLDALGRRCSTLRAAQQLPQ